MKAERRLSRTVVGLGLVSLLTDAATEMAVPLLPVFLATLTAAPAIALGAIEGAADAVSSLLKLVSGRASDRTGRRRPWVLAGYTLSGLSRPLLALALAPWHVVAIRVVDRTGKGLRSSPRDALLAAEATEHSRGFVFGFHRAMDHAGAVVGPLLALLVLWLAHDNVRTVFVLTLVPGILAIAAILMFVREADGGGPVAGSAGPLGGTPGLWRVLVPIGIFSLGNASDIFLLLKVAGSDASLYSLPLLWVLLHVVKSASSPIGGTLADRLGPRPIIVLGWLYYAGVYLGFAIVESQWAYAGLFVAYGLFHGLAEPAEKALVAQVAGVAHQGSAFGWYHLVCGIAALPASIGFGLVWQQLGPGVAFGVAAALAVVAALTLVVLTAGRKPSL